MLHTHITNIFKTFRGHENDQIQFTHFNLASACSSHYGSWAQRRIKQIWPGPLPYRVWPALISHKGLTTIYSWVKTLSRKGCLRLISKTRQPHGQQWQRIDRGAWISTQTKACWTLSACTIVLHGLAVVLVVQNNAISYQWWTSDVYRKSRFHGMVFTFTHLVNEAIFYNIRFSTVWVNCKLFFDKIPKMVMCTLAFEKQIRTTDESQAPNSWSILQWFFPVFPTLLQESTHHLHRQQQCFLPWS